MELEQSSIYNSNQAIISRANELLQMTPDHPAVGPAVCFRCCFLRVLRDKARQRNTNISLSIMRPIQLLLAAAALIGAASAGQGYLFPQSACRVRCENGGACAYDTEDPSIHSCICLVGVYEGDRCERLVPGAEDPAAATTTTTTTTTQGPTTPSAYEVDRRRHEEHRLRIMEERRKHEEERTRMEEERRRLIDERARQEETRRAEMESRGRDEEARRRTMEEEHRRRMEDERRRDDERRKTEERRVADEKRRVEEEERQRQDNQQKVESDDHFEPTHKLDYDDYEDSLDGARMEEVPDDKNTVDEDEDIDRVQSGEMEKPDDLDDDEDEEEMPVTTPEPTKAVTFEVEEDDYVTSTTPTVELEPKKEVDDSRMSGENDDYWDHTPEAEDKDVLPPLPGGSTEEVVSGTQIDQTGRAVGVSSLDEDLEQNEELEQDGEEGWMMVKRKQTASASAHSALTTSLLLAAVAARWAL